jgi:hypothetical protein
MEETKNRMKSDQENDRVRRNTAPSILTRIDKQTDANIRYYCRRSPAEISARLRELEQEWSIERYLQTNASLLALGGAILGLSRSRKWFFLSATVMGFLLQHGVQGWCPPLPVFRRMGIRTRGEIDREKFHLKAARGDFEPVTELETQRAAAHDSPVGSPH